MRVLRRRQAGAARALLVGMSHSNSATAPALKSAVFEALCLQLVAHHLAAEDELQEDEEAAVGERARDSCCALLTQWADAR